MCCLAAPIVEGMTKAASLHFKGHSKTAINRRCREQQQSCMHACMHAAAAAVAAAAAASARVPTLLSLA